MAVKTVTETREFTVCDVCGKASLYMKNIEGKDYCPTCHPDALTCTNCGKNIAEEYAREQNDVYYCSTCFLTLFANCTICNTWYNKKDIVPDAFTVKADDYTDCFDVDVDICRTCAKPILEKFKD